ncbi:hypothetical protein CYMTET_37597 [Cymbomonas tetramitiformis]|uniref:Uncharacterized protein n=1 Tax=Cymbomonas tetramitiformis TaxID=36881 RepID=A0AAE0CDM8_9CHLO|nr:hypothetical protein CYMTET_37597 [Cymbomonas tetramitiformis]
MGLVSALMYFMTKKTEVLDPDDASEKPSASELEVQEGGTHIVVTEDEGVVRRSTRARKEPARFEVEEPAAPTPRKIRRSESNDDNESAPKTPKTPGKRKSSG